MTTSLLAIETSAQFCSVALRYDNRQHVLTLTEPRAHATHVLEMIDAVLKKFQITLQSLDAIAFSQGPGSFTGLRIAASIVQGLAYAVSKPVIGVSTLQCIAQGVFREHKEKYVLVAQDARMNEIYCGLYQYDGEQGIMCSDVSDKHCTPESVYIPPYPGYIGVGSAWLLYQPIMIKNCGSYLTHIMTDCLPHAQDVLDIAEVLFHQGALLHAQEVLPVYQNYL